MFVTLDQATFFSRNSDFLLNAVFFMVLAGFLYGYAMSFTSGIRRALTISPLFVLLFCTGVIIVTLFYLFSKDCRQLFGKSGCADSIALVNAFSSWTFQIMAMYFSLIGAGYIGITGGIVLRFPTEWIMQRFFNARFQIGQAVDQEREKMYETMNRTPGNRVNSFFFGRASGVTLDSKPKQPQQQTQQGLSTPAQPFVFKQKQDFQPKKEQWGGPLNRPQ